MERKLSVLTDKVAELAEAVQGLGASEEKFAQLQQQLEEFRVQDEAEDSAYQEQITGLQQLVSELQADQNAAVEGIDAAIQAVRAASGQSEPPVEEPPAEPPVEEQPAG